MKKPDIYLKEYAQKLSDENLKFLAISLSQNIDDDMSKVFNYFVEVKEIDRWLSSAQNSNEFYEMLDFISEITSKEYEKRYNNSPKTAVIEN